MIEELRLNPGGTALILTDFQPDFMPGGTLAVAGGDEIVPAAAELLRRDVFTVAIATQDWHPPGHISFASSHPERSVLDVIDLYGHPQILWPDHCVQGSAGAQLAAHLPWERVSAIVRKGNDPLADSYSAFRNNWGPDGTRRQIGLAGYLKERHITDVVLCGLARDFCVKWSAEDAAAAGFRTIFLWDLTRPVDPASDEQVRRDMERVGVEVVRGVEGL